ncbi:MAG: hypothetical protein HY782_28615 [Chloroflexi bacterium]|nr:hypothetical protein [Chloroflexota bacterium]
MSAVAVKDDLLNVAKLFGDVETVITDAVRHYAIDQCVERIESARAKIREYEVKFGTDYLTFASRVQTDAEFLRRIEAKNPLWEEDAMEWKYRSDEVVEWTQTLERILKQ